MSVCILPAWITNLSYLCNRHCIVSFHCCTLLLTAYCMIKM